MKKVTYKCSICNEKIELPSDCFGLTFSTLSKFTFSTYDKTDNIHICYNCAVQMQTEFKKPEVIIELESFKGRPF